MFVVQSYIQQSINEYNKQVKSPNDKGAREFKKLISFLSLCDGLALQRAPYLLFNTFSKMQSQKRENTEPIIQDDNLSAYSSRNELQDSFHALHNLSSIHGKETFGKLKQSLYEAIICFIESDLPLEGIRLSHVQDLHELHCFCDKMMGTDFDTIDLHLNALLS